MIYYTYDLTKDSLFISDMFFPVLLFMICICPVYQYILYTDCVCTILFIMQIQELVIKLSYQAFGGFRTQLFLVSPHCFEDHSCCIDVKLDFIFIFFQSWSQLGVCPSSSPLCFRGFQTLEMFSCVQLSCFIRICFHE